MVSQTSRIFTEIEIIVFFGPKLLFLGGKALPLSFESNVALFFSFPFFSQTFLVECHHLVNKLLFLLSTKKARLEKFQTFFSRTFRQPVGKNLGAQELNQANFMSFRIQRRARFSNGEKEMSFLEDSFWRLRFLKSFEIRILQTNCTKKAIF